MAGLARRAAAPALRGPALPVLGLTLLFFLAAAAIFFLAIGRSPPAMFVDLAVYAFGDGYSLSESLVKATPILFCALAVALPARLGLISVGADGQLFAGAIAGTAIVLAWPQAPWPLLLPAMLLGGAIGGGLFGGIAGWLRARLGVNETIVTLLLNFIGLLLVNFLVYGPWKDPGNQGWPATIPFPDGAIVPHLFGSRAHLGLALAILAAFALHLAVRGTRWGLSLSVLRGNPRVGRMVGLSFGRNAVLVFLIGGAMAGLAGITETSAIQGRLQPGLSAGYGLTGFLVAWLAGHHFLRIVPIAVIAGGLLAAGDTLQLFARVPAASTIVLQALLFIAALAASGLQRRRAGG